jgi:hypothetical protein
MDYIEDNFTFVRVNGDIFEVAVLGIAAPNAHLHFAGHLLPTFREFLLGEIFL